MMTTLRSNPRCVGEAMFKYELTTDTMTLGDKTLYRIRSLKSFGGVSVGQLGGYIERYHNLSQAGSAWVDYHALVYDRAKVSGSATVRDHAVVHGDAQVSDSAQVYGHAEVYCDAVVRGEANVFGNARVYGEAKVYGSTNVFGNARIHRGAHICGRAKVHGEACVYDYAIVQGCAEVYGNAAIGERCILNENATISASDQILMFSHIGSEFGVLRAYLAKGDIVMVNRGCFSGTLEQFEDAVDKTHGAFSTVGKEYALVIELIKKRFAKYAKR